MNVSIQNVEKVLIVLIWKEAMNVNVRDLIEYMIQCIRNVRKSTVLKEHVQKMENVSWRAPYLNVFVNLDLLVRNVTMISMNASQILVSINVKTQGIIDFVTRGKKCAQSAHFCTELGKTWYVVIFEYSQKDDFEFF